MSPKALVLGLLLLASAAFAADQDVLLVKSGPAGNETCKSAIVGDTKLSADSITYDAGQKRLECRGNVRITLGEQILSAKDCTILLGNPRVLTLKADTITVSPKPAEPVASKAATQPTR
jgi:lipopolysaccharide export system protein LptA